MATPTSTTADHCQCSCPLSPVTSASQLPTNVPAIVENTVVRPMRPLAAEMRLSSTISGMLPSLAGPNKRGLRAREPQHQQHEPDVPDRMPAIAKRHDDDLADFAGDDHLPLAEAVGQISRTAPTRRMYGRTNTRRAERQQHVDVDSRRNPCRCR